MDIKVLIAENRLADLKDDKLTELLITYKVLSHASYGARGRIMADPNGDIYGVYRELLAEQRRRLYLPWQMESKPDRSQ